jgi:integrase
MGEGYIRQRGNTWQVIVHAGRDPITGKRRNLTGTTRTKREAQALRAQLVNQANEDRRPTTDATLAQLLERWLEMADLA